MKPLISFYIFIINFNRACLYFHVIIKYMSLESRFFKVYYKRVLQKEINNYSLMRSKYSLTRECKLTTECILRNSMRY